MTEEQNSYTTQNALLIRPDGTASETQTFILKEHELDIIINEQHVMRLVCTKQDLKELVFGRMLTGGFIESADEVSEITFRKDQTEASVSLNKDLDLEKILSEEKSYSKLPRPEYKTEWIFSLAKQFEKGSCLHDITYSTHSCMLVKGDQVLFMCEDIGRHNAIDKAVGHAMISGIDLSRCILYTSGRVPVDMAEKSIAAGIPVLVSKSAPTAQAIDLARTYGLTIIGNAYPDSIKVYDPYE